MNDWMMLQAQVHQGQSHFATAQTRSDDRVQPGATAASPQQQQQPLVNMASAVPVA